MRILDPSLSARQAAHQYVEEFFPGRRIGTFLTPPSISPGLLFMLVDGRNWYSVTMVGYDGWEIKEDNHATA